MFSCPYQDSFSRGLLALTIYRKQMYSVNLKQG